MNGMKGIYSGKYVSVFYILLIVVGCGQLPEEERKAYADEMAERTIMKVSPQEIVGYTESVMEILRKQINNQEEISESTVFSIEQIGWQEDWKEFEQIREAYSFALEKGLEIRENRQETEEGDIVYTLPILKTDSSGLMSISAIINIEFRRKEVVREISLPTPEK